MRAFYGEGWGDKVNFVDENNVLVGYDMGQCCCEHADFFFARKLTKALDSSDFSSDLNKLNEELKDYQFDPEYFETIYSLDEDGEWSSFDAGGMVVFRLVNENGEEAFLHLFNVHNGYYSHGFEMVVENRKVHNDWL